MPSLGRSASTACRISPGVTTPSAKPSVTKRATPDNLNAMPSEYSGGRQYSQYSFEVPTERVVETYMFVDERSIYFPEKMPK